MKHSPVISPSIIFSEKSSASRDGRTLDHQFVPTLPRPGISIRGSPVRALSGQIEALKLAVQLINDAAVPLGPPITTEVSSAGEVTPEDIFEFSFLFPSCKFESERIYQVVFRVGDEVIGQRPLPIALPPQQPEQVATTTENPTPTE